MKILNITFLLFFIGAFITGCYDDKGSYAYSDINQIEIEKFLYSGQAFTVGDTIRVNPNLTFSKDPSDTLTLNYEWRFAGKTRKDWNQKNFFWIVDTIARGNLEMRITDTKNGMVYLRNIAISLSSEFDAFGWAVLADKDNHSSLSFIKEREVKDEQKNTIFDNVVYQNIYETRNNGELLGQSPLKLHMHFCQDKSSTIGQVMVIEGSSPYMVDLNGKTLKKEITINQAFANQTLPADFKPVNAMFMRWCDLIENYDGKIYSRIKGTDQLFHSSAFLQTPLQFEGKVLEQCHLILAKYMKSACAIAHDKKNNRLLLIMDASYGSAAGAGEVKICPGKPNTGSVEGWVPLDNMGDNKVIHIGYFTPKGSGQKVGIFMILQDKNGKYWTQEFVLKRQYDTSSYYLEECERNPTDLTSILKENSIIYALPYQVASEFVLISSGADIYLYDRNSPNDKIKLFYTCEGTVTCIEAERFYHRHAGVGTDNGKVVILNMEKAKNLETKKEKVIWDTPTNINFGKIIDIRFKTQYGNDWN